MKIAKESKGRTIGSISCRFGLGLFLVILVSLMCRPYLTSAEGLPPGWAGARPYAINDKGDAIGYGYDGYNRKGFLYSGGIYTELLPPGWANAMPYAINDKGEVTGYGYDGYNRKGFLYSGGTYTELSPPRWMPAMPYSISEGRQTVDSSVYERSPYSGPQPARESVPSISVVDRNHGLIFFLNQRNKKH